MTGALVLIGAGGQARVVIDAVRATGRAFPVACVVDSIDADDPSQCAGVPILVGWEQLATLRAAGNRRAHIAVGDCRFRNEMRSRMIAAGFELVTVVHPSALVAATAVIGAGSFLAAGAVLGTGARTGECALINTGAIVDHDCTVGDASHIAPGAVLAGHVDVGEATLIGAGAVVRDRITIGDGAIVGAGSLVLTDIPGGMIAFGHPARVIRPIDNPARGVDRS